MLLIMCYGKNSSHGQAVKSNINTAMLKIMLDTGDDPEQNPNAACSISHH